MGAATDAMVLEPAAAKAPVPLLKRDVTSPAPQEADPDHGEDRKDAASGSRTRLSVIRAIAGVLLSTAAAGAGYLYWDHSRHFETTDDAFIAARQFSIAPKVTGYLAAVPVGDNQHVVAGDVLARVDDRDYRVALTQAQAQVAGARASIENIDAQIKVQDAQIVSAEAQLDQAQAGLVFAQQQATRYQDLMKTGSGTVQNAQQYDSQLRQQQATVTSAQAALEVAKRQVESLKAQRASAVATLAQSQAQLDQAELNLSYTTVKAAQAGRVANLTGAVGQYAQAGTAVATLVPDLVWVTANFKESQLNEMRPGQPVALAIDAYPGRKIHGSVASIQPGSGTAFSLLPAQNATGNYVKIVQRVPVKIVLDNPPSDVAVGPGMSVVPTVRVNPTPSLYERLRSWL